ncbi:uncharacterized protein LOC141902498 [Tubulanus polymorphus]|uniref:uncharacterized protein LOC141902498 n=1 Tax=Tubulanus polymorphus TaxID=672921 RepID=UPI003DA28C66
MNTKQNPQNEHGLSRRAQKRLKRKEKRKAEMKEHLKNENPGYGSEFFDETEYYLENGLRKVYPYYYTFSTYCKERWYGRQILDVFSNEFRHETPEEYKRILDRGSMTVNGSAVSPEYTLRNGDFIQHTLHRHEVPVTAEPIKIIHADDDVVIINKPSSIPVHPCGRYRHNSIVFILGKEYGYKNLRTIYRLDRLTSGVLVFGRSHKRSLEMEKHVIERKVEKDYVCRVEGEFPSGQIICNEPLATMSPKIGLHKVSPDGKESSTMFERLSYNGKSSVVRCKPFTGRTHQIRVHLQYLGYPIVNDPLYNSPVYGPNKGKNGDYNKSEEQLIADILKLHSAENWADMNLRLPFVGDSNGNIKTEPGVDNVKIEQPSPSTSSHQETTSASSVVVKSEPSEVCDNELTCDNASAMNNNGDHRDHTAGPTSEPTGEPKEKRPRLDNETGQEASISECLEPFDLSKCYHDDECRDCRLTYKDPKVSDLVMFLHAYHYKGPDWEYETKMPYWAADDFTEM